jgi:hypothetical protein
MNITIRTERKQRLRYAFILLSFITSLNMPQKMANPNSRTTNVLMTTMEALDTSPYLLTNVQVDHLEVEPGYRGSGPLPLITTSSACVTITSNSASGNTTDGTITSSTTVGITNLDRVSSRAKQLLSIGFKVTLVICTQDDHMKVVVDGVTLVLIVARHR